MSLQSLRTLRLQRLRPARVSLVLRDCPQPRWKWLLDDPAIVWLSPLSDARAHDLRPLVGLQVAALVDDLGRRADEVRQAVIGAGGLLIGMADGERAIVADEHPWSPLSMYGDEWRSMAADELLDRRYLFWSM